MKVGKVILAVLLLFPLSPIAYSAIPADSTSLSPNAVQPRIDCTRFNFDGVNATSTAVFTGSPYNPADCVDFIGGGLGFALGLGGGQYGATCPDDYPYLHSTRKEWGIVGGNGGAVNYVQCCTASAHAYSASSGWENPVNGGCS